MKPKQIWKIITDILMTVILIFLMAYNLVGEAAHEWLGIGMFALFILHHILNMGWSRHLFKGKYTAFRMMQSVLAGLAWPALEYDDGHGKNLGRNIRATGLYFLFGAALSALFQRYVPADAMTAIFGGNEAFGVLMAVTVGVPLYACGGGTIPLLQAWLGDGMRPMLWRLRLLPACWSIYLCNL